MIDPIKEELLTLKHASAAFPKRRAGSRPHLATLHRWAKRGCRGVVLETVQVGCTRCTSREAIARFIGALTAQVGGVSPIRLTKSAPPSHGAWVDAELAKEGL